MIRHIHDITVTPIQSMGGDNIVAAAAWVSSSGAEALERINDDPKAFKGLIKSLVEHRHGTPFEHAAMSFFVHAPLFVWREWHRHRIGFSYNEESGRYKQLDPVFWVPRFDRPMAKPEKYKAMRPKFITLEEAFGRARAEVIYSGLVQNSADVNSVAYQRYEEEIANGIANEVARRHLPLSIYSSCWVSCNPRSLMNFLSLRTHDPDAAYVSYPQLEIEEAAKVAEQFLEKGWPLTHRFFNQFGRAGV